MICNPLVSVVIPVYKTEKYLSDCIYSVINQSYKNTEIILVDDGSPDNCPLICDNFANKYYNINVIHKKNGGLSESRNFGIEKSNGEYILFLDSDDFLIPDAIEGLVNDALINDSDIVMPDRYVEYNEKSGAKKEFYHFINRSKISVPKIFALEILLGNGRAWRATALLYRKSLIQKYDIRFPLGYIAEDIVFNLKFLAQATKLSIYNKSTLLQNKRINSITTSFSNDQDKIFLFIDSCIKSFLDQTSQKGLYGDTKRKELLCRNTIVFISILFSKKCYWEFSERIKKAIEFLNNERVKEAFKIKKYDPFFNNYFAVIYFRLMFWLIKKRQFKISFKLAEFADRFKTI